MKKFKIRCSAIGNIMGGSSGITEKQLETIATLEAKEKLTDKQKETLNSLIKKRDTKELGQGSKTYCKDWLKGQLLNYEKIFRNKYTDKGNIMEDESIDFIAEQLGYGFLIKNEDHYSDEYMQGTPDIVLKTEIIDVKNSWDASTFPLFDDDYNKDYYWQLQGYMHLTGRESAKLIYTLTDTPEHLIINEAKWYSFSQGFEEIDSEIYERFYNNMTYKGIDNKYKIRVFEIERNQEHIDSIIENVIMCREYIDELLKTL